MHLVVDIGNTETVLGLLDPETGELTLVDTSSRLLRRRYATERQNAVAARQSMFRRMDAETIEIRTDRPYVEPLVRYFRKRERRQ